MPGAIAPYGQTAAGQAVHRITLEDGIRVQVLTFGAIIETLEAPDRDGRQANLALGLDSLEGYETRSPHFGAMTGRYAGRIAGARFVLDGIAHELARNNGANAIHGGPGGFDKAVWRIDAADERRVTLSYTSKDGEEGFPGTLSVQVAYSLEGGTLRIRYQATTDRPTVLNLTNHSYFNLAGEGAGSVLGHVLQIEADRILAIDAASLPTGEILPVAGTPFDFRAPHPIGARIREAHPQILLGRGYDHYWVLPGTGLRRAATVWHPPSGRRLEVHTDQPGIQVYTANMLTGTLAGPAGRAYRPGDALCLETQHYPDSPNRPGFPSTVLRPGAVFRSATDYVFSIGAVPAETEPGLAAGGGWVRECPP